eukprot:m.21159 g.21159  ORF g.21159 m.21159 type:complete len:735 (+) comp12327_c0_seq1:213-2417(+)
MTSHYVHRLGVNGVYHEVPAGIAARDEGKPLVEVAGRRVGLIADSSTRLDQFEEPGRNGHKRQKHSQYAFSHRSMQSIQPSCNIQCTYQQLTETLYHNSQFESIAHESPSVNSSARTQPSCEQSLFSNGEGPRGSPQAHARVSKEQEYGYMQRQIDTLRRDVQYLREENMKLCRLLEETRQREQALIAERRMLSTETEAEFPGAAHVQSFDTEDHDVQITIGRTVYHVPASVLCAVHGSLLHKLVILGKNQLWFECDASVFSIILQWLSGDLTSAAAVPNDLYQDFVENLRFFGLLTAYNTHVRRIDPAVNVLNEEAAPPHDLHTPSDTHGQAEVEEEPLLEADNINIRVDQGIHRFAAPPRAVFQPAVPLVPGVSAPNVSDIAPQQRSSQWGAGIPAGARVVAAHDDAISTFGDAEGEDEEVDDCTSELGLHQQSSPVLQANCIIIMGGIQRQSSNSDGCLYSVYSFNTRTLKWSRDIRNLLRPNRDVGAVIAFNRLYALGGLNPQTGADVATCYRLEQTNEWTCIESMLCPRYGHTVAACGNSIFAIGGCSKSRALRFCEKYDPREDRWTEIKHMQIGRRDACTGVVNGRIYVIGGSNLQYPLRSVEVYDPVTDVWESGPNLPHAREGMGCAVVNNVLYVIGGVNEKEEPTSTIYRYDPSQDVQWSVHGRMPRDYAFSFGGCASIENKIYITGGFMGLEITRETMQYDPVSGEWKVLDPIPESSERFGTAFS